MVGVDVRLQNPLDLQVLPPDGFDQPVRRTCRGPRGFRVEIQHAIDDRGLGRCRIGDNIADVLVASSKRAVTASSITATSFAFDAPLH